MGTDVTWEHAASVSCVMLKAPGLSKITVKYPMNYMHSPPTTVIGTRQQHKSPQLWSVANQMQNGAQMDVHIPSYR